MADVKWIKIATDIFDDEKILLIESLPDHYAIITVWFKLLCLAGKQNNSGVFMISNKIPYTDEMFATIFRMPINTVRLALETFSNFGMVEIVNNVVTIPNWEKHQSLDSIEKRNEYMKNYMREKRAKQAELTCKVNSKPNSKVNVSGADKNREEENRKEENITITKRNSNKGHSVSPEDVKAALDSLPDDVRTAFEAFRYKRKELKKPMSDNTIVRTIEKLKKMTSDPEAQIQILHNSEDHCWLDIYPLKDDAVKKLEKPDKKSANFTQRPDGYYNVRQFYE